MMHNLGSGHPVYAISLYTDCLGVPVTHGSSESQTQDFDRTWRLQTRATLDAW